MEEKRRRGRPLKFKTVKAMQEEIERYFASCDETGEPLTVTGLALTLGIGRETLMDYQNRDSYADIVKRAKLRVENAYEKRLIARGNGGDVFALKNFGWTDKKEVAHSGDIAVSVGEYLERCRGDEY